MKKPKKSVLCPDCGAICVRLQLPGGRETPKLYCSGKCNEHTTDVSKWKYVVMVNIQIEC